MFSDFLSTIEIEKFLINIIKFVPLLFLSFWLTKVFIKYFIKTLSKVHVNSSSTYFLSSFLGLLIKAVIIVVFAGLIGIPIAPLTAALGAASVTIGLAIKDSLSNISSGVLIAFNKLFNVGDYIKVGNSQGTVVKIDLFFTTLLTVDNRQISIPNAKITAEAVENYTALDKRRIDLSYIIDSHADLDEIRNTIKLIIDAEEKFIKDPAPRIEINNYHTNGIEFIVQVWCYTKDYWDLYFYLQSKVKEIFDGKN